MPVCSPIGVVETPFETPADAPRQGQFADAEGELVLDAEYVDGLAGLDTGDSLDVVWFADRADRDTLRIRDGQRGVFTSRSQDRPNPVCITRCAVLAVDGTRVRVRGVDMCDGTPLLDLKIALE